MSEIIQARTPVGEIAATLPATVAVLESHGIDYCCGGIQTLEQAAGRAGVGLEALIEELAAAAQGPDSDENIRWDERPLPELLDHLLGTHHEYTKRAIRELPPLATKVVAAHGKAHPELVELRGVVDALLGELNLHLRKEEEVLFPMLRELAMGRPLQMDPRAPISVMEREHDEVGGMLRRMRELGRDYAPPDDACTTWRAYYKFLDEFEADLHRHIHLENNVLHRRARMILARPAAKA
ncbi:MAG TPA: iron-sulfur cluster repair di-iron protein [Planctomycetota bacterium]